MVGATLLSQRTTGKQKAASNLAEVNGKEDQKGTARATQMVKIAKAEARGVWVVRPTPLPSVATGVDTMDTPKRSAGRRSGTTSPAPAAVQQGIPSANASTTCTNAENVERLVTSRRYATALQIPPRSKTPLQPTMHRSPFRDSIRTAGDATKVHVWLSTPPLRKTASAAKT